MQYGDSTNQTTEDLTVSDIPSYAGGGDTKWNAACRKEDIAEHRTLGDMISINYIGPMMPIKVK